MLPKKIILVTMVLAFVLFSSLASAGAEDQINKDLQANKGENFTLPAGTYTISNTIIVPEGTTFQGEVSDSGELLTKIVLTNNARLSIWEPMIELESNTKLLYLDIDANSMNQGKVPTWKGHSGKGKSKQWGQGYHNIIKVHYKNNVEIAYNDLYNGLGDGARVTNSKNVKAHHNKAWKLGHDAFFFIRSEGILAHDNYIQPRINSAFRGMDVYGLRIFSNTIKYVEEYEGIRYDCGPPIQLQHDSQKMEDIEVCDNEIFGAKGPGFWVVEKSDGAGSLKIYNNAVYGTGTNPSIDWVGGMVINGWDDIEIYNNVFDQCVKAGIFFYAVNSGWDESGTAYISKNIFVDSTQKGGYGILNSISHNIVSSENCFYGNAAGDTSGCSASSSDVFVNPRTSNTPSDWSWNGEKWECPNVKPSDLKDVSGVYDGLGPATNEEIQQFEFNDIFDILNTEFADSGRTNQTEQGIRYEVKETDKGRITGGIKIVGFKDQISIDNISYIPDENATLVKYSVIKSPSYLWGIVGIANISEKVNVKIENGTAKAVLTVKMKWYKEKTDPITKKHKKSYKTSKAVFNDSSPAPKVLVRPTEARGIITYYNNSINPHTLIYVPSGGLTKIVFNYAGNTSEHVLMIGERSENENGVKYTNFSRAEYWRGNIPYQGNSLYIKGALDKNKLNVTCFTPYESFPVNDFEYIEKAWNGQSFSDWVLPFVLKGGIILFFLRMLLRIPFS